METHLTFTRTIDSPQNLAIFHHLSNLRLMGRISCCVKMRISEKKDVTSISCRWNGAPGQLLVVLLRECLARTMAAPLDARSAATAHQRGRARADDPSRRPDDHLPQLGRVEAAVGRAGRGDALSVDPGGECREPQPCDKLPPHITPCPPPSPWTLPDEVTVSDTWTCLSHLFLLLAVWLC